MEGGSIGINQRTTQLHFIMEAHVETSSTIPTAEFRSLQNVTECSDGDWCHIVPVTNKHFPTNLASLPRYHYLLNFKIKISNSLISLLPAGSTRPHISVLLAVFNCRVCARGLVANLFKRAGAFLPLPSSVSPPCSILE